MGKWQRGGNKEEYRNMEDMREERGILEYGRDEGSEINMGIWQRGGKRGEYGNMADRRKERGILFFGKFE